jgi:putative ABC transport system substrate-binding protein
MNGRRHFLVAAGSALIGAGISAHAQQNSFRIGWISPSAEAVGSQFLDALRLGLRDLGYVEGRNLLIDARWGDDSPARIDTQVAELVAGKPHVIVTQGPTPAVVLRYTQSIPVVFGFSGDPVEAGFVQSLARPGGNITGMTFLSLDLVAKRIQTLREVLPQLKRVAVLANPQHAGEKQERNASEQAARALGLELSYLPVTTAAEIEPAMEAARRARCEAVDVYPDALMASAAGRIAVVAMRDKLASVSGWSVFPDSGLLMSYGPNLRDVYRRIASYADKILRGARPADLPVELPTTVEMIINLRTAHALGLKLPQNLLVRADRVIE